VYDQLKALMALNIVVELDIEGKAQFAAAEMKHLDALLVDSIDRLSQSRDLLAAAFPSLVDNIETVSPKLRFFEGEEGVKQLLKDIMWHDQITMSVLWPQAVMCEVFDQTFLTWFDERRKLRKISIEMVLIGSGAKEPELFCTAAADRTRTYKKPTPLTMASLIYDSKVAFISSTQEAYGFIVESNEFAALQRLQWQAIWNGAS